MAELFLDLQGNPVEEKDRDYNEEFGYWEYTETPGEYHEGHDQVFEQSHFEIVKVLFSDNSEYIPIEDDPHIIVNNATIADFDFQFLDGEEQKEIIQFDVQKIIDVPYAPPVQGWREYIPTHIYHPYTEEEIANMAHEREMQDKRQELLDTGADRLQETEELLEELILLMADIAGGEE